MASAYAGAIGDPEIGSESTGRIMAELLSIMESVMLEIAVTCGG